MARIRQHENLLQIIYSLKFDQEVDSSTNPLIIYMLDTTTNKNFYPGSIGDYNTKHIQSKWNTGEDLNPDTNKNIPVLNNEPWTVKSIYTDTTNYYDEQWKHHHIHLEVRHPDGYIIGSYLNKPMLKELSGSNNTTDMPDPSDG